MSIISREVVVDDVWIPLVEGPCVAWLQVDVGQGIRIGGDTLESGRGYPLTSGSEYRFELRAGDRILGISDPGDVSVVNVILSETP